MLSTVYVAVLWNAESGMDARGKRNQPCSQGTEGLGGVARGRGGRHEDQTWHEDSNFLYETETATKPVPLDKC